VDKPTIGISLVEIHVFEVTPPIEVVVTEHVATVEPVSTKISQGRVAKFNITTSASACKNHNFLNLACVSLYLLLNPKNFAEVPMEVAPPVMLEPEQAEETTPPVIDPVLLGLVEKSYSTTGHDGRLAVATVEIKPTSKKGEDQPSLRRSCLWSR